MKKGLRSLLLMGIVFWMASFLAVEIAHGYAHGDSDPHSACAICYLESVPVTPVPVPDFHALIALPQWVEVPVNARPSVLAAITPAPSRKSAPRAPPFFASL